MTLEGKWSTNRTKFYTHVTGSLSVKRNTDYKHAELIKKLNDLNMANDLSFYKPEKKIDTVKPAVIVKKVKTKNPEKIVTKQPEPVLVEAAADTKNRKTASTQTIYYVSDSLLITLYDNGEIDGDTVSILLNGKVIIPRKGLDTKFNSKTIYINSNTPDSMMPEMYAENLGSIPPNTGVLILHDGGKSYEVFFSADFQTNAAVILRRKKN